MRKGWIPGGMRVWLELFRISNLPTVWTNVSAAWFLSGAADGWALSMLIAGTSLVYVMGMALNDAFDANIDRHQRSDRPIPSGRVSERSVWKVGVGGMIAGSALMIAVGASITLIVALAAAVLAYNWFHKRSPWTAGLMALCRAMLWWIPATLPSHHFTIPIVVWSAVLFIYVVGVTLLARDEGAPMSSQRSSMGLFARFLLFTPLIAAVSFTEFLKNWPALLFIALAIGALRVIKPTDRRTLSDGISWLLAGIPIIDAMAIAPHPFMFALVAGFPLCRLLQRSIAAT